MKPRMPQKQKRRPRASDTSALEANSPWKYKALPLPSWSKWEILVIMGTMISLFYMWLYSQSFHFHVAHVYARFGYSSAQLIVGQRYLQGSFFVPLVLILLGTGREATCSLDFCICRFIEDFSTKQLTDSPPPPFFFSCFLVLYPGAGVVKDEEMAMHWFRQASKQGHPRASFNLAVGKLKNMTGSMEVGDVEILLNIAARQGVQEAQELLENVIWTRSKLSPTKKMRVF
uniref:Uncharacterized protein n=1 Tax=Felis catus TaxID=9685 RepID=A0ABI7YZN1_FELCA